VVESSTAGIDFFEVFPIPPGAGPNLTAYEVIVGGQEQNLIGGKLAYRLGKQFPGHWVWTSGRIVTDQPQEDDTIKAVTEALWREQRETYRDLRQVRHDPRWRTTARARDVLQGLFPLADCQGKRVVIHRDGYFRGDEKRVLQDWAKDIGAEFSLVEVLKTGTPRGYRTENRSIIQPEKGLFFRLTDLEAFLVSSLPPFRNATPPTTPIANRTSVHH